MKNQFGTIKTNPGLYRVVMGGSGGYRRVSGGSDDFRDTQTLHHNIYIIITHLFARCCPVVSWFMETMAELGCCPPSSNMENKSKGTEHMFVSART